MEYKARRRYTTVVDTNGHENDYPDDIQMYDVPPVGEMSLEEFQEFGFDRLKGNFSILYLCMHAIIRIIKPNYYQLCCSITIGGNNKL